MRLAPEQLISAATLAAVLAGVAAVWLATHAPSLGLAWSVADDRVMVAPRPDRPAPAGLSEPRAVTALEGGGQRLAIQPGDLTPEPDVTHNAMTDYRGFMARQGHLATAMRAPDARVHTAGGAVLETPPQATRPLSALHWSFWLQLICGALGLITGVAVWAYRQNDAAAAYYALTGISLAAAAISAAVYSTRELALSREVFGWLTVCNKAGTLLYTAGFIAVLWHYPQRLGRFPLGPLLVVSYALLTLAGLRYWLPNMDLAVRLPVLVGFCGAIVLGVIQWRRSRGRPLARAGLRWFLFSWFFGSSLFLVLVFVPPLFGVDAASAQGPAFLLLLIIHLALAAGILRYRLFELDRWWSHAWLLAVSGLLVCALDLLLIHLLGLAGPIALSLSLALIGWLYFPLRQWLWSWLADLGRAAPTPLVQRVTEVLARPEDEPDVAWRVLLKQLYEPQEIHPARDLSRDAVSEGGLALDVAGAAPAGGLRLRYCRRGTRLFRADDLALLADLRQLFDQVLAYRQRLQDAVNSERDRVARDLHDDVGARLLTLAQTLEPAAAERARAALDEMRAVVRSMHVRRWPLAVLLDDWRAEVAERCEAADIALDWSVPAEIPDQDLDGVAALDLSRILREVVSNAIRHAAPDHLQVAIACDERGMDLAISHAYSGDDPDAWRPSLGLVNLRERSARLGGGITWQATDGWLHARWSTAWTALAADSPRMEVAATTPDAQAGG